MDEEAYLATELLEDEDGEVIKEGYDRLSGELNFVV